MVYNSKYRRRRKSRFNKAWILVAVFFLLGAVTWALSRRHTEIPPTATDTAPGPQQRPNAAPDLIEKYGLLDVTIPESTVSQLIHYPGFNLSFNAKAHQPNWVAWELTADEVRYNAVGKRKNNFAPDPDVEGCPTLADYRGSGYDRGHMAPAADMKWNEAASDACFLLTNMSPQHNKLNTGAWRTLEEKCRNIALRDSAIVIICGPVLSDRIRTRIGDTGVWVPKRYFKVVLSPYTEPMRAIAFIMPNSQVTGGMQATAVSIDEVEQITGFDFFAGLPDDIENAIEAECNFPRWSR